MFFMGAVFCGASLACSMTPTSADDITYVELKNGRYDDLYITNSTDEEPSADVPEEWDWETVLHAQFDDNPNAGNVDWGLNTISHLLIKRKKANEFKWKTIAVKEISSVDDFTFIGYDYTNESGVTYQYGVSSYISGIEGNPATVTVDSAFDGIFIAEKDGIWGTKITDGYLDYTRNFPNSTVVTIHNQYPVDINTSVANYDSGTCEGKWFNVSEDSCEIQTDDSVRVPYQRGIIDILSDRKPKILKHFDGRIYLVKIEDQVQDNADGGYGDRKISFSWTEIGDVNSEQDLYYSNLSDVTEEFWSSV